MTRYLIAIGTSDYGAGLDLPFATHDADRVVRLFTQRFGYTRALDDLARNPATDAVRRRFGRWLRDRNADDVVVFYFAGHGDKSADGRHYLLCADSEFEALTSTALATEDLLRLWSDAGHPVENLLFVLDVCYAGAGVAQMDIVAKDLAAVRRREEAAGIWVLAAARARDEAEESLFVDTLERAIDTAKAGQRAPFLAIDDIVDTINADLTERGRSQRAVCLPRFTRALPPFVPNPKYWPDAPPEGVDLATQRKLRRLDLEQHFEPRSRGVERGTDPGSLFCGRTRALAELTAWLTTGDGRARVVTGSPGAGKSAVLSRLVMTVEPDLAIHARRLRLDQVVAAFGALGIDAADADAVLRALRARTEPLVVVVDALDEAGDPATIARELLRPLSMLPAVRLLVGTRPEHLPHLRPAIIEIDLDAPEYIGATDVADYVTKILLAEDDPHQPTPYRDHPDLAATVAAGVADRANNNFLVARMHALRLAYAAEPLDVTVPGWRHDLKSDVGAVFDEYLSRFGADADRVRRLLTPLAYAEGQGLPWDDVWAPLATALSGVPCTDDDIAWLLSNANSYLVEATEYGRSVYRLYHQALVDHLRQRLPADEAHRRLVRTLRAADPFDAHPYVHRNLARHAAAAGLLDELIADPAFVLSSDLGALRSVLPAITSPAGELIAAVIDQAIPFWPSASHLQLAARRLGADDFADRVPNLTWSTLWADVVPRTPHRVLAHGDVTSFAVVDTPAHGAVVVVAFSTGVIGVFDVDNGDTVAATMFEPDTHLSIAPVVDDTRLTVLAVAGGVPWRWDVAAMTVTRLDAPFHCRAVFATTTEDAVLGLFEGGNGAIQIYDVAADRMSAHVPSPDDDASIRVIAADDGHRATLFAVDVFDRVVSMLDLSAGEWRPQSLWTDGRRGRPNTVVYHRALPDVFFEAGTFDEPSIRDAGTGRFVGTIGAGTVLAAGALSNGQTVLLIESSGLGVWAAADIIESSSPLRTDQMIEAVRTATRGTAVPAERTDMTLAEFVHQAHAEPGLLGLDGPATAADVTRGDGDHLFAACQRDGQVKLWRAPDATATTPVPVGRPSGSASGAGIDMTYWQPAPPPRLQTLAGHDGTIQHAAFTRRSTGQDVVITAGKDGFVRRWDLHQDNASAPVASGRFQVISSVAIHGDWVVHTPANSNEIRARALADGAAAPTPPLPIKLGWKLMTVANAADTSLLVDTQRQAHLLSWGRPLVPLMTDVDRATAAMCPDGTVVVVSTNHSGAMRVHRLVGNELSLVASTADEAMEFNESLWATTLSTDEVVVVSAGWESLRVWHVDSLTQRGALEVDPESSSGPPKLLATGKLSDGRAVALVADWRTCRVVGLDEGAQLGVLPGGEDLSYCKVRTLDDGRCLAVGAPFGPAPTLGVWDLGRMSLVTSIRIPAQVNDLDVSPDGVIALATEGGLLTIKL